ncbi:hypothetical protein EJB05_47187, partial [Eragrostis curvula]
MLRLSLPCCLLLLFSFLPAPDAQEFVYNGFADAGLTFEGEASIESGRLGLTSGLEIGGIGHAFYRYPVSFETIPGGPIVPSFTTTFVFEISMFEDYNPRGKGSDGLAFVLSSTNKFLDDSLPGQYLGLFNIGTDNNHVAININNLTSINSHTAGYYYSSYGGFQFLTLASDGALQLWVEYDGETQQLNVTLGFPYRSKPEFPLLSTLVNMSSLFPSVAYIGFSASTGTLATRHYILGWSFKINGEAPELNISALPFPRDWGGLNNFSPPVPHRNYPSQKSHSSLHDLWILARSVTPVKEMCFTDSRRRRHFDAQQSTSNIPIDCSNGRIMFPSRSLSHSPTTTGDGRLHFQLEHDWTALHLSPTDEVDKSFVRIGHSAGRLNKNDPISHRQGIPKCTANRYGHSVSNLAIPADRMRQQQECYSGRGRRGGGDGDKVSGSAGKEKHMLFAIIFIKSTADDSGK